MPISASEKSGRNMLIPDSPSYLIVMNLAPLILIFVSYVSLPVWFLISFFFSVSNPVWIKKHLVVLAKKRESFPLNLN